MGVLEVIRKRKSVRKYKPDPIPEASLLKVLEAARLAPSAKNLQPWRFIIIQDKEIKKRVAEACQRQYFMAEAPIIIAACGFPDHCYEKQGRYMKSWPIDVAIAMEHLILQAAEEGLGTCWIGAFEEEKVKEILGVPEKVRVVALTPLGYPAHEPKDRGRKILKEIISHDKY